MIVERQAQAKKKPFHAASASISPLGELRRDGARRLIILAKNLICQDYQWADASFGQHQGAHEAAIAV